MEKETRNEGIPNEEFGTPYANPRSSVSVPQLRPSGTEAACGAPGPAKTFVADGVPIAVNHQPEAAYEGPRLNIGYGRRCTPAARAACSLILSSSCALTGSWLPRSVAPRAEVIHLTERRIPVVRGVPCSNGLKRQRAGATNLVSGNLSGVVASEPQCPAEVTREVNADALPFVRPDRKITWILFAASSSNRFNAGCECAGFGSQRIVADFYLVALFMFHCRVFG